MQAQNNKSKQIGLSIKENR